MTLELLSQHVSHFVRSARVTGIDFRALLPPLSKDDGCTRVSSEFSRAVEEFARTPKTD